MVSADRVCTRRSSEGTGFLPSSEMERKTFTLPRDLTVLGPEVQTHAFTWPLKLIYCSVQKWPSDPET